MDTWAVIGVLGFIIVLLFLFFAAFLLTVNTDKKLSNQLLAAFLIVTAIDVSAFFYTQFISLLPAIEMLRIKTSNFKDPLLFLYMLSIIYANFKLKKKHFIHVVPWLMGILVLMTCFFMGSKTAQIEFLNNYGQQFEVQVLKTLGHLISAAYFVAQIYYVLRYRKLLLENYTDKNAFKNYNWLKKLIILITIGQLITLAKNNFQVADASEITNILRIITLLFGVFFIFWLVLKALNSPKLFRGVAVDL